MSAGDQAIVGDWSGDGTDKIGTYNAGTWWLDFNGTCAWDSGDLAFSGFGGAGYTAAPGHW